MITSLILIQHKCTLTQSQSNNGRRANNLFKVINVVTISLGVCVSLTLPVSAPMQNFSLCFSSNSDDLKVILQLGQRNKSVILVNQVGCQSVFLFAPFDRKFTCLGFRIYKETS